MTLLDNKTGHPKFSTFFSGLVSNGQGFILFVFKNSFFACLLSCVPSQGHEGPVKVRKQPQVTIQEMEPHQALSDQAPFHLQGKHITDYLACVETTKTAFYYNNVLKKDLHYAQEKCQQI